MEVAAEFDLELVNPGLLDLEPGHEPPRCCNQHSFRVTLPEEVATLNKQACRESDEWYELYEGRSYVEGVFGNLKNPRTENLTRGVVQKTGLLLIQLTVTLICAAYNVHVIRARHDRMESGPIEHLLLSSDDDTQTHVSLTAKQENALCTAFLEGVDVEALLVSIESIRPV